MAKKKEQNKKTIGEVAVELQQKEQVEKSPIELQKEHEKEYIENLTSCVKNNIHKYVDDFFVVVISKNEKLLYNVIRLYFFDRASCPTPDYDQTVFIFKRNAEQLIHLWTVPNKEACITYLQNKDIVAPEEYAILENIIRFDSGDLFKLCKQLNREEEDSPLLVS